MAAQFGGLIARGSVRVAGGSLRGAGAAVRPKLNTVFQPKPQRTIYAAALIVKTPEKTHVEVRRNMDLVDSKLQKLLNQSSPSDPVPADYYQGATHKSGQTGSKYLNLSQMARDRGISTMGENKPLPKGSLTPRGVSDKVLADIDRHEKETGERFIGFHGTTPENADAIFKEGFDGERVGESFRGLSQQGREGVYTTEDATVARRFGSEVIAVFEGADGLTATIVQDTHLYKKAAEELGDLRSYGRGTFFTEGETNSLGRLGIDPRDIVE